MTTNDEDKKFDYGWHVNSAWDNMELPKKAKDGTQLKSGMFVKNKMVSGKIVFYTELLGFRVQVIGCRYNKKGTDTMFYYPTPLGREENSQWEVYKEDCGVSLDEWLTTFPKKI